METFDQTSGHLQLIVIGIAGFLVLFQTFSGWKLGGIRQFMKIFAFFVSYVCAFLGGPALVPYLRVLGYPNFILTAIGGVIAFLASYLALVGLSAVLFKKTSDKEPGAGKFMYGLSGAFFGFCFGVLISVGLIIGLRIVGAVAESASTASGSPKIVAEIAHAKDAVSTGPVGAVIEAVDPIPASVYEMSSKIGKVAASPESAERLLSYPGVSQLASHPKIRRLGNDPEIQRELRAGNYLGLLRNAQIVAVANDPEISAAVRDIDFARALDHAVRAKN